MPHGAPLSPAFGKATNVVPEVEIDVGLFDEVSALGHNFIGTTTTLTSATTTLSTTCLLWDQQNSRLAAATSVVAASSSASIARASSASASAASASASASASATAKKGQGSRMGGPEKRLTAVMWGLGLSFGSGVIFF